MKKIILFIVASIFLIGLINFVSAGTCDFSEFNFDEDEDIRRESSIEIEAGRNEEVKYSISEGDTCFLGSTRPTSTDCRNDDLDPWRSGTVDPNEEKRISLDPCRCYEVELEHFDCVECRSGRDSCDGEEFLECEDGFWENQGEIIGECDVEC